MTTGTPVVISRIQNRRGMQVDFDNLYPSGQPGTGPDVLQPGELALCTDTGNMYMGTTVNSVNGYYISVGSSSSAPTLIPLITTLPPSASWANMLTPVTATPFFKVLYSIVDTSTADPNIVGTNFSKNGELAVTSTTNLATLADTGIEVNTTMFDISFQAIRSAGNIQLQYMHNFPAALTFSTSNIVWAPLI